MDENKEEKRSDMDKLDVLISNVIKLTESINKQQTKNNEIMEKIEKQRTIRTILISIVVCVFLLIFYTL